jgi:hypothetical protein
MMIWRDGPKNELRTHTANDEAFDTALLKNGLRTHTAYDKVFDTGRALKYTSSGSVKSQLHDTANDSTR